MIRYSQTTTGPNTIKDIKISKDVVSPEESENNPLDPDGSDETSTD